MRTAFEPRNYVVNRSDYQKYQEFQREGREKCENIKHLAMKMRELFPMIESRIEHDHQIIRVELGACINCLIPHELIQLIQSYI